MTHFYEKEENECSECGCTGHDLHYECDNCGKIINETKHGDYDPKEISFDVDVYFYIRADNKEEKKKLQEKYYQDFDACSPECFLEKIHGIDLPDDIEVNLHMTWYDLKCILANKPKVIQP